MDTDKRSTDGHTGNNKALCAWRGIPLDVIRKRGAASRIQVLPDGTLRVTISCAEPVERLLEAHTTWIQRKLAQIQQVTQEHPENSDRLLLDGEYFAVREGSSCAVDRAERVITYTTPLGLKRALTTLLRDELTGRIDARCDSAAKKCRRICVRMQKTRWASCSARGTLSFNLALAALPPDLRDYIVAHELAHFDEPNHSRKYWDLLESRYRGAREADRRLRAFWILIGRNRYWQILWDLGTWENAFRRRD